MPQYVELNGKKVVIKVAFLENPMVATVAEVEEQGIWLTSTSLMAAFAQLSENVKNRVHELKNGAYFVPHEQIHYILAEGLVPDNS